MNKINLNADVIIVLKSLARILISAGGGAFLTHLFYKSKLRKEQKVRFEDVLGEKIAVALLNVRKFELQLREYDMINFDSLSSEHGFRSEVETAYPSIFNSKESLFKFQNELGEIIRENESFLDKKSVAFLLSMEQYLGVLMLNVKVHNSEENKLLGVKLYNDFQRWQKDFDAHIVKQLNKSQVKVTSLKGKYWDFIRKKAILKYVNRSDLMTMIENN